MNTAVRIAVIGGGLAGSAHAVALRAAAAHVGGDASELELVAIASSSEERGEALRRRSGFERWVPHWRDLLELDLDGVVIAGPNDEHADAAVAFLEAGVGVLCEKPLAATIEEAERMVAAAERTDRPAVVGYSYRWSAAIEEMRRLVEADRIGEVIHVRGRYWADACGGPEDPGGWRMQGPPPAGALADIGSHVLDLAEFVVGDRIASVRGGLLRTVVDERPDGRGGRMKVENEDLAVFGTEFSAGALGEFSASRMAPGVGNGLALEIVGTEGSMRWDFDRQTEYHISGRGGALTRVPQNTGQPYTDVLAMQIPSAGYSVTDLLALQARSFVGSLGAPAAAAAGLPLSPTFAEGVRNMRLLQAVADSAARAGAAVAVAV